MWEGDKLLVVSESSDILWFINKYKYFEPRSFYGAIEVFKRLEARRNGIFS